MSITRAHIEALAEELATLSPEDRARVLAVASRRAPTTAQDRQKSSAWQRLHDLEGIVNLGGDALTDCAQLYDG